MLTPYKIVTLDQKIAIDSIEREEPLGTKQKFWFLWNGQRWLFKYRRAETGEDWAERIAAALAMRLWIPHAEVELASYSGRRGVVSCNFTVGGMNPLVHGNDLLVAQDPAYPHQSFFRVREHTVDAIAHVLENVWWAEDDNWLLPDGENDALGLFTGYLMLDALIANTDRHHENWGVLNVAPTVNRGWITELAPSYDHASSLGRELSPDARKRKYGRPDGSYDIEKYLQKARSAIYQRSSDTKPLSPLDAFRAFAKKRPKAAQAWLDRLDSLSPDELRESVDAVPSQIMSEAERAFAHGILACTRLQLLEQKSG